MLWPTVSQSASRINRRRTPPPPQHQDCTTTPHFGGPGSGVADPARTPMYSNRSVVSSAPACAGGRRVDLSRRNRPSAVPRPVGRREGRAGGSASWRHRSNRVPNQGPNQGRGRYGTDNSYPIKIMVRFNFKRTGWGCSGSALRSDTVTMGRVFLIQSAFRQWSTRPVNNDS
jgi:hypothetical protein